MPPYKVEFSEIADAALKRLSACFGWEFPDNQFRSILKFILSRDPFELGLERCPAWRDRHVFVGKRYAGIYVRVLVEIKQNTVVVWSLRESSQ